MPLVLYNFPKVQLKSYVVQSITDEKTQRQISYRFSKPSLIIRQRAIEKALAERDRLMKLPDGERLIDRIKLYLEFNTAREGQNTLPKRSRIYLLNGKANIDDQLLLLDAEAAHWIASEQFHTQRNIIEGNKTWVAIDQMFTELYYFYN
jgi:hypothetical protein